MATATGGAGGAAAGAGAVGGAGGAAAQAATADAAGVGYALASLDKGGGWRGQTCNRVSGKVIMFSEYDVIRLRSTSNAPGVPIGAEGTILIVHPSTPPAYEVEFVDDADESLGTFTIPESDLEIVWRAPPAQ